MSDKGTIARQETIARLNAEVKQLRMSNTLLRDTLSEVLDLHASYDNIVRIIHQVLEE